MNSPSIQRALFFKPIPPSQGAGKRYNPLLVEVFSSFFPTSVATAGEKTPLHQQPRYRTQGHVYCLSKLPKIQISDLPFSTKMLAGGRCWSSSRLFGLWHILSFKSIEPVLDIVAT
jgi:hypothetical protein